MTHKTVVRISLNTLYRDLSGEGVLLQLDSGEYFGLDEVSNRIWQLIAEVGDIDVVRERMLAEYEVDSTVLSRDVARLLGEMVERKLVELDTIHDS